MFITNAIDNDPGSCDWSDSDRISVSPFEPFRKVSINHLLI